MNGTRNTLKYSQLIHDKKNQQFRISIEEVIAKVDYRMREGLMLLVHSEVPYSLRGQGIGRVLVEKVFEYIDVHNLKASALCSFIAAVANKSDKWKEIIS
ncbi:MAG: GNAT family N-acetyltransferase [Saprospiraceae bacterium]|nr:GNAT family N-acetyltransferase [Saprospiraceae bacterium]|tara:strand:- start:3116 stop:3415 length:300 start_codon:yes stop_codon:yes gene_type:complete